MSRVGTNRGLEQRDVEALHPRCAVVQLTDNDTLESQHTYYDICPWSYDERFIVFSSAPIDGEWAPFGHDTLACRQGRVNLLDTQTMQIQELTQGAVYLRHGGAFCIWHPAKHKLFYWGNDESFASLDLDTGKRGLLPARIRELSPDGRSFATITRSARAGGQGAAIGLIAEDGTNCRELVSRERLYELTPNRNQFRPEDMTLGNTKWRPDSQHIMIAMWAYPHPEARRSLYIVSRDGTEARWLTYFADHHSWTPDGEHILFNGRMPVGAEGEDERRMFLIDFDGTNRRVVFDQPIGSHPLMHPDGRRIVDADSEGVYAVRLDQRVVERLAAFSRPFDGTHHGTHPHPVWNRDGSRILYNSAESGHCELYHISLKAL